MKTVRISRYQSQKAIKKVALFLITMSTLLRDMTQKGISILPEDLMSSFK